MSEGSSAAREMVRVCRPGGRIVLSVLNKWSLWALRRRLIASFRESIFTHCRFYATYELEELFGPVQWATSVFAPPGLPETLIPLFDKLELCLQKWTKPFGAYLVIRKDV